MRKVSWLVQVAILILALMTAGAFMTGCPDESDDDSSAGPSSTPPVPDDFAGTVWVLLVEADLESGTVSHEADTTKEIQVSNDGYNGTSEWNYWIDQTRVASGQADWEVRDGENHLLLTVTESSNSYFVVGEEYDYTVEYESCKRLIWTYTDEEGVHTDYYGWNGGLNSLYVICGLVYNGENQPIANQDVLVSDEQGNVVDTLTTDDNGYFFKYGYEEATVTVTVNCEGYQDFSEDVTIIPTYNFIDAQLEAVVETGIRGTVFDYITDSPIEGAIVTSDEGTVDTTDAIGSYFLTATAGARTVIATATDYIADTLSVESILDSTVVLPFELVPDVSGTGTVEGTVTLEGSGVGLPHVYVKVDGDDSAIVGDYYGNYSVTLDAGLHYLTFSGVFSDETDPVEVWVTDGDVIQYDCDIPFWEWDDNGLIYGYVYDDAGEPVYGGARVSYMNDWIDTNEDGYYFMFVYAGDVSLTASAEGYEDGTETFTVSEDQLISYNFVLEDEGPAMGTVFGYVTDSETGSTLAGALVSCDNGETATADAQGYYSIETTTGYHDFTATLAGYISNVQGVDVTEDSQIQLDFALVEDVPATGTVYGYVRDSQTGSTLAGALVSSDNGETTTVDAQGYYSIETTTGYHDFTATLAGYISNVQGVDVTEDSQIQLDFALVEDVPATGTVYGYVRDSQTGYAIEGALVACDDGESVNTDASGYYSFETTAEYHDITVSATDYYENEQGVTIVADSQVQLNFTLSPVFTGSSEFRFVVTWGEEPSDLDSHLRTPEIEGYEYHIYYGSRGSSEYAPYATLDIDDTNGYGPETVTIDSLFDGTYRYYIHNYTGTPVLAGCGATVQIYDEDGLYTTVTVPATGTGYYWRVCELNGADGSISVINEIVETEPTIARDIQTHPKF